MTKVNNSAENYKQEFGSKRYKVSWDWLSKTRAHHIIVETFIQYINFYNIFMHFLHVALV